ncbi:MAG TPA: alpha/beta family hydrolase [Chryseolinea sp.]|nr:alpha/beta family hydrolase [Chryseolinea sp.]
MESRKLTIKVSESIGSVSALIVEPEKMKYLMILAHGAGAGMRHQFMEAISKQLAEHSIGTLRFNFPFTENDKKRPDPAPVAEKTISVVWEKASELFPKVTLLAAGKSFGGRMSSHVLSKTPMPFIKGVVFFGFPLHAPGKPSTSRADHLQSVPIPMLFLQGTRDALAELKLIQQVTGGLKATTLVTFEGADHSFKAGKNILIPELAEATSTWLNDLRIK